MLTDNVINYVAAPTVGEYIASYADVTGIMGPIGSGKTSGSIMKTFRHITEGYMMPSGSVETVVAYIRNTKDQLRDTTLRSWQEWFPDGVFGHWYESGKAIRIEQDGIKSTILFRSLDTADDIRRLLSLNLTFAFVNEAREIPREVIMSLRGRLRRAPNLLPLSLFLDINAPKKKEEVLRLEKQRLLQINQQLYNQFTTKYYDQHSKSWHALEDLPTPTYNFGGLFFDTNAPEENSDIYNLYEQPEKFFTALPAGMTVEQALRSWRLLRQPEAVDEHGNINPYAENLRFLAPDYYPNLMVGATRAWVDVYLRVLYGSDKAGEPVYKDTFNPQIHSTTENIPIDYNRPLYIGLDFGRTPAAVIYQPHSSGALVGLKEVLADNMGLDRFLVNKLKPELASTFHNLPVVIAPDPSGVAKDSHGENSSHDILKKAQFKIVVPHTNQIDPRIAAVERMLTKVISGGRSGYCISKRNMPVLYEGYVKGYKYEEKKDGSIDRTKPVKNRFSHPHDANQYIALVLDRLTFKDAGIGFSSGALPIKQAAVAW